MCFGLRPKFINWPVFMSTKFKLHKTWYRWKTGHSEETCQISQISHARWDNSNFKIIYLDANDR